MESQDNLHNADGNKKENDIDKNIENTNEESLDEQSMLAESQKEESMAEVSTDEEIPQSGEPEFKPEASSTEKSESKDAGDLDGDAMVAESQKKEAEVIVSDEELEKEDDTEEVHSDEDEHDEHAHHELEMPDYGEFTPEALIAAADKLLKNEPIQKIKDHFDAIRRNLLKQLNEERQHKLEQFLEGGGVEMDFEYIQPQREKFRNIFGEYRSKRQAYYKDLEDKLNNNLKIKLDLIEQIKEIVTKDESIGDTFKEFNNIQQEWRNTGPVPRSESGDLWRTYHHHVENFYEFIKINKELRDLDFKKNREAKEKLIVEGEALLEKDNVPQAFKALQQLHKKWKIVGPVERENRDAMWDRFSDITKKLHDKREEHYASMREKSAELLEEKKKLVEQLKGIDYSHINSHHKWQESIKKVESIREAFRKMGRINHPDNDKIWDEFREILKDFNHQKNQYYKDLKKAHHVNLEKKRALVDIAHKLKDSDDWKETTNEMKRIQAQWKQIGHVPKSESDKIWKEFRAACNHFFDRLTQQNKDRDKQFEGNFTAKKAVLDKLSAYEPNKDDQAKSVNTLKEIINEWKQIGRVPRDKNQIESDFNKTLDDKFKAIDMDRKESQRIRFENKLDSLTDGNDDRQLRRERQAVRKQIEEAQKELTQLETNISFFSSSDPNSPLLKDANKRIKHQQDQIEMLDEKVKILNVKIREVQKADEEEAPAEDENKSGEE
ncbi:DUF349 domain-containing protein [Owenweeksia hongkongensis]|uniref:DUF349 domain-containing protein n=1 Tax=Owenweeksia hongkongensis TaxID=253245 RepID=UPI003A956734